MAMAIKSDWMEAGLEILVRSGAQGLTIEALCRQMSKTKGSFYHHFGNREGFLNALLEHWRTTHTQELIDLTPETSSPDALVELHRLAQALPQERELAFRQWAKHSEKAAEVVTEVDRARVSHLENLYLATGRDRESSRTLAWLEYCYFLGAVQLGDTFPKEQRRLSRAYFEKGLNL